MSRRYDTRTTIFSPEGRLYQVEYAMEAIEHAGTCLGILASDGVILAAERKITNKLLDDTVFSEKIYRLDDNTACSVAGITSDANVLTAYLRRVAQWYLQEYQECIPVEQLIMRLCDVKQSYTQYGGKRPFGVSILYMGWDPHFGFQLYQSDPSGNYGGWKATCIGSNHQAAISLLKQDYKETPSLNDALQLAVKVLHKTLDSAKLNADKVEIATLTREREEGADKDKTQIRVLPADEVNALIKVYNEKEEARKREEKAKEERAKQAKEAATSSTS